MILRTLFQSFIRSNALGGCQSLILAPTNFFVEVRYGRSGIGACIARTRTEQQSEQGYVGMPAMSLGRGGTIPVLCCATHSTTYYWTGNLGVPLWRMELINGTVGHRSQRS